MLGIMAALVLTSFEYVSILPITLNNVMGRARWRQTTSNKLLRKR